LSDNFAVLIARLATAGAAAVPDKSPAKRTIPFAVVVASVVPAAFTT